MPRRRRHPQPAEDGPDPDMVLNPGQPEFTVVNLPTTLRVPKHRFAFRVTPPVHARPHRGRVRRPAGRLLRFRRRRADRPRVALRHHERLAGRHLPHERPHDRVVHAVQRAAVRAAEPSPSTRWRRSRAPTTSTTTTRRSRRVRACARPRSVPWCRGSCGKIAAINATLRVGEQHEPVAQANWSTTTTRSFSASAAASACARPSTSWPR